MLVITYDRYSEVTNTAGTLKDYTHFMKAAPGFSAAVDAQLMNVANITSCPDHQKYVIILMDEMHIKEYLVYDKHTGM